MYIFRLKEATFKVFFLDDVNGVSKIFNLIWFSLISLKILLLIPLYVLDELFGLKWHRLWCCQVVTAVEPKGDKIFRVVETKRLTEANITKALDGKLQNGTILITDNHPSYKAFGKTNTELTHKTVKAKEHFDKNDRGIHLQTVNQTHKQIWQFIGKFNGVSTKYLQNYLNWYAHEGKIEENKAVIKQ